MSLKRDDITADYQEKLAKTILNDSAIAPGLRWAAELAYAGSPPGHGEILVDSMKGSCFRFIINGTHAKVEVQITPHLEALGDDDNKVRH